MNRPKTSEYKWYKPKTIKHDECFECGSKEFIDFHHVVPATIGGKNALPLCAKCHDLVHGTTNIYKSRVLHRIGVEKAKKLGKYKGRIEGSTNDIEKLFLNPKVIKIIDLCKNSDISIRGICRETSCSPNYFYKICEIYKDKYGEILKPQNNIKTKKIKLIKQVLLTDDIAIKLR
jgi:hypothetical protein